jgi:hypothetical protein
MVHAGGRPPIHNDPKVVEALVDSFIKSGDGTLTGLAIHLGFCEKGQLYDYAAKPEFRHSIKRGLMWVEHGYEMETKSNGRAGSIFALKNFGWKDENYQNVKQEIDMNVTEVKADLAERRAALGLN